MSNTKKYLKEIKPLPKNHRLRKIGPWITFTNQSTESSNETPSSSEEQKKNLQDENPSDFLEPNVLTHSKEK